LLREKTQLTLGDEKVLGRILFPRSRGQEERVEVGGLGGERKEKRKSNLILMTEFVWGETDLHWGLGVGGKDSFWKISIDCQLPTHTLSKLNKHTPLVKMKYLFLFLGVERRDDIS